MNERDDQGPAPVDGVVCMHECPDGSEPAGLRCSSSFGHLGDHRALDEKGRPWHWTADDEPAPREPTDPSVTCPAHWFGFGCNLDPGHPGEHAARYVQCHGSTGRVTWEGASIPREESPTDGTELAELLREALPAAREASSHGAWMALAAKGGTKAMLGRALLMVEAERGRLTAALADLRPLYDAQVRESQRLAALAERYEDERDVAMAELAEALALRKIPPGKVLRLLAELKHMREEGDGGMREAIEAVREHLGAPTPLDLAAGEVCALLPREYPDGVAEFARSASSKAALAALDVGEGDVIGARAQMADAAADLLAGMLACDAPADATAAKPCPIHATPIPGLYCSGCTASAKGGS